jgi:UDP-N-acetylenolpyruvoylglucosamine reductase
MRWRDFDGLPLLQPSFLDTKRRFHFVGIGGIGMSALAFFLLHNGHEVSGSDVNESEMVAKLREAGAVIAIGHAAANLDLLSGAPDGLIYSSAVDPKNPERAAASERGVTQWHRAQLLAAIANRAKCSIAVSGTHGKSTTSAMIAHVLEQCGKNPTALLGAKFPPFGSNARIGDPDLVVLEADESDGSFTLFTPAISVITNVEAEHLENYDHSEESLWDAFAQFVKATSDVVVLNADDKRMFERLHDHAAKVLSYTLKNSDDVNPGVPGEHNRSNAAAALAVAVHLGISRADALKALETFHGVSRRFEKVGEVNGVVIYDDYAHHPTEVKSTLEAAKTLKRPLIAIFQPHRYSRTQQLGAQFGKSFKAADVVIITELYSAFEEPIEGVSGRIVFDAVRRACPNKKVLFASDLQTAKSFAVQIARSGDAIFTLGAGDITQLPQQLLADLEIRQGSPIENVVPNVSVYEPLAHRTTMKVGGPARWWIEPDSEEELQAALEMTKKRWIQLRVIGAGSNIIVDDDSFDGAVIKLGKYFSHHRIEGNQLIAGGAAMLPKLAHFALKNNLGGAEWMCGIPGTVGGSLWGNAGSLGFDGKEFRSYDCAEFLKTLVVFDRSGRRFELTKNDIQFSYRRSSLQEFIVTEAVFDLYALDDKSTFIHREAVTDLLKRRRETQPVSAACSGCIWKNPKLENCAGMGALIEELGLKGMRVGDAEISTLHGNFVINTGVATSRDILTLIEQVEAKVLSARGIKLYREVQWW